MLSQLLILNTILYFLTTTSVQSSEQFITRSIYGDQVRNFDGECNGTFDATKTICSCQNRKSLYFDKTNEKWICKDKNGLIEGMLHKLH